MSRWGPRAVAAFGYDAGFRGPELAHAVAIAMAFAGGEDSYTWRPSAVSPEAEVGLFGVPVVEAALLDERLVLTDPRHNAAAAFGLWRELGGFDWSPVWRAGTWRLYAVAALEAAKRPEALQSPPAWGATADLPRSLSVLRAHVQRAATAVLGASRAILRGSR